MSETVTVWEGEWIALKKFVTESRESLSTHASQVNVAFDATSYYNAARKSAAQYDLTVAQTAKYISGQVHDNQWALPAVGITSASVFVASKSLRWGAFVAVRNGVLFGVGSTCFMYPQHIREAFVRLYPF